MFKAIKDEWGITRENYGKTIDGAIDWCLKYFRVLAIFHVTVCAVAVRLLFKLALKLLGWKGDSRNANEEKPAAKQPAAKREETPAQAAA